MRVALINPPSPTNLIRTGRWVRESRANQSWPPILLAYACGLLEREGNECLLLDCVVENISSIQTYKKIMDFNPGLIAIYWSYDTSGTDLQFTDFLGSHYKVVLVGPWSFCTPEILRNTTRILLMTYGEFEHTLLELTKNIHYTEVKGLIWRNHINGEIVKNPPRPLEKDLDSFPFVTKVYKQHLDIDKYRQTSLRHPFVDLYTARGCPHKCSFCVFPRALQGGPSYRERSVKNVIEELWFIKNELSEIKQIFFQDDTLPQKRATELSQAILDNDLKICWGGYARAELDYDTLRLMKESGCRTLHVGYEIPIQKHLDIIQKDIKVEQMEEFAKNIKKLELWTSATFMIFPWENPEEIKYTIKWAKKIKPKRMNFIQAQAYPNTPLFQTLQKFGKDYQLMSFEEMKKWEKWGFKHFYLYNCRFWWEVLKSPGSWRKVFGDALGLVKFLWEK